MLISPPYGGGRAPVLAKNVVASSQPLATQAGIEVLQNGGNAVDAALATAITLTVVEPTMNGLGGDGFALVWDGKKLHGMNASGRAPAAWTPEYFVGKSAMDPIGWNTVTVPGVVSGWINLSRKFGKLPFAQLFKRAIDYAENGFPVSPVIARQWREAIPILKDQPGFAQAFLIDGKAPTAGQIWRNMAQANTLREIANTEGESFYSGALAKSMVEFSQSTGGCFTLADFAANKTDWVEPLAFDYGEYTLHEIPPNGSGIVAQMTLGILEAANVKQYPANSAQRIHLQVEAMRMAFADAYAYVSDAKTMNMSPSALLDREYLASRAALINHQQAGSYGPGDPHSGGTVYLCAADSSGMMISYIQSNFRGFGSGVVAPGGIAFHNRGMSFSLVEGHPNQVAPGKRPFHTIIPAFLSKGNQPAMAFGVMGGNMQPQGHVQFVMRFVDEYLNPQSCSDAPRWRIDDLGKLTVESSMPTAVVDGLKALGHDVMIMPANSLDFGSAQAIALLGDQTQDAYIAGSDHRRDGLAAGF
ncbi:gamma-glutamyltransferase family protein [Polynucleobacter sp. es-EL-1]|uniref:gamma-glutamyltransferase family protein n=1 Tax=Polynucleobacter sp. es-EL-1 TaxID=1855652 RepID=UPI001BFDAA07|nr:gamma-glutamyltransferase family protein [Polynucleobacter sp. es-EL-1]QWE11137.1 gamma-glutamyltransferase family protein [Polynucleobacter sp. es-EL-1]